MKFSNKTKHIIVKKIVESIQTDKELFVELSKMDFEIQQDDRYPTILLNIKEEDTTQHE